MNCPSCGHENPDDARRCRGCGQTLASRPPSLFHPAGGPQSSAGLRPQAHPWGAYAIGYRLAAERLFESLGAPHQGREFLSYPLIFVSRQYLELRLKDIIASAHELSDAPKQPPTSHDLMALWRNARQLAESASPGTELDFYKAIESCLDQFQQTDDGTAFRYPVDKSNQPSLPNLDDFDLGVFESTFAAAAAKLDGISSYFHEALQAKRSE